MQTVEAAVLSDMLADAGIPSDTIVETIDLGGYESTPGLYVLTESLEYFARTLITLGELIGHGASMESVTTRTRGGAYGGGREMCAQIHGWTLDGPMTEPATGDDLATVA